MSLARSVAAVLALVTVIAAPAMARQAPPEPAPAPPTAPAAPAAPTAPAAPAVPAPAPAAENRIITSEPLRAVVLPMKGSYMQHPAAFERLSGFLASRGASPTGAPFARYLSDPSTPEAELAWEVGLPVGAAVAVEPPFELRDIPATLTAVHVHRGSFEELGTAWPEFIQWVFSNGYQIAGPATQVFTDLAAAQVELRLAVRK